mgnify:CR=1 FL=1
MYKTISWRLLVGLAVIQPWFAATSLAAVAKAPPADHFHIQKSCLNCHSTGVDTSQILKQNNNSCLQCHTRPQIREAFSKANRRVALHPQENQLVPLATPLLGMRYPIYSAESRVGAEPNEMVAIPAGEFIRGTNQRLPDEGPQHTVTLPEFMLDRYEVTNLQYKKFIDATAHRSPDHFRNRTYPAGKADHPVTFVSWNDADAYCAWAGKRLPSDQEWEKAARSTDGREYPWGNEFDIENANMPLRWQALKQFGDTTPVGAFEKGASPYGVYDMSGNVWEWTASWYEAYPGNTTPSESYGQRYKTLKGGSWFDCSIYKCGISAPVYNRAFFASRTRNDTFGFRCAKDAPPNRQ